MSQQNAYSPIDTYSQWKQIYQRFMDLITPHASSRWSFALSLLIFFYMRIMILRRFYLSAYVLSVFVLNSFIAFLTPLDDPDLTGSPSFASGAGGKSGRSDGEFRPFMRVLSEFNFWKKVTAGSMLGIVWTWFDFLDIDVYWPLLVVYFIFITVLMLRAQIKHMIKYKYVPFDFGKQKFGLQRSKDESLGITGDLSPDDITGKVGNNAMVYNLMQFLEESEEDEESGGDDIFEDDGMEGEKKSLLSGFEISKPKKIDKKELLEGSIEEEGEDKDLFEVIEKI